MSGGGHCINRGCHDHIISGKISQSTEYSFLEARRGKLIAMKLTIRIKLLFGFLTLMVLLVAGYVVAEYRLDRVKQANAKIREEWTEISLVNKAQLSLSGSMTDLARYLSFRATRTM